MQDSPSDTPPLAPKSSKRSPDWGKWAQNITEAVSAGIIGIMAIHGDVSPTEHGRAKTEAHPPDDSEEDDGTQAPKAAPAVPAPDAPTQITPSARPQNLNPNTLLDLIQKTEPTPPGKYAPRNVYKEVMYYLVQWRNIPNQKEILHLIAEKDPYKIIEFETQIRFGAPAEIAEQYTEVVTKALKILSKKDPTYYEWALKHHDFSTLHLP